MPKHLARFALFALPLLAACGTSETSTTTAEVGDTGTASGSGDVAVDTRPDSTITIDVTDTGPATCAREDAFAPNQSREAACALRPLASIPPGRLLGPLITQKPSPPIEFIWG